MNLELTEAAAEKLRGYMNEEVHWLLDLDDGVGPFSKEGSCALYTHFRLLIVAAAAPHPDYQAMVSSTLGDVYIKEYSQLYLAEEMQLDFREAAYSFQLKSASGYLDPNVELIDLRKR